MSVPLEAAKAKQLSVVNDTFANQEQCEVLMQAFSKEFASRGADRAGV